MIALADDDPLIPIGRTVRGLFEIRFSEMKRHGLLSAVTGAGKSFLGLIMMAGLLEHDIAFGCIDPKGDTVQDFESSLAEHWSRIDPLWRRKIIILRDDFSFEPLYIPPNVTGRQYRDMLARKVDWTVRAITRVDKTADPTTTARRTRHTANILHMLGVRRGKKKPIGFHKALDACQDIGTKAWWRVFNDCKDHMDRIHAKDLIWLATLPPRDRAYFLDSSITGLRKVLSSPVTMRLFASDAPPVDFEAIMRNGQTLLCDFGPPKSREVGHVLSHFVFSGLLEGAMMCPPRRTYVTFVEEAFLVFGPDVEDALLRARSFNLSVFLLCNAIDTFLEEEKK